MRTLAYIVVGLCWVGWWYPFVFRAPHVQKRPSITLAGPTRAGLLLECLAFLIAFLFRLPPDEEPGLVRIIVSIAIAATAPVMAWTSVTHLGRQFRINAGLYEDHQLVRTGPYAIVRHPIYASLFAMLLSTGFLLTPWLWLVVSVLLFIVGTEIRVRTEDGLLASRFGAAFDEYRRRVPAYIPGVR